MLTVNRLFKSICSTWLQHLQLKSSWGPLLFVVLDAKVMAASLEWTVLYFMSCCYELLPRAKYFQSDQREGVLCGCVVKNESYWKFHLRCKHWNLSFPSRELDVYVVRLCVCVLWRLSDCSHSMWRSFIRVCQHQWLFRWSCAQMYRYTHKHSHTSHVNTQCSIERLNIVSCYLSGRVY